ncbi:MAG: glycosyltransferase [Methylophilaceae bacterium]|nr:glycosyltransferase [Methylophilaceae bacterium]
MYTGGIDHRKNIEGLIRAFGLLPKAVRDRHQLAIVCAAHEADQQRLEWIARDAGLSDQQLVMTGFVPEDDLLSLYNACALFVFPSWHEGFGLPALEAMACGRPTIGANTSSLPEVIGLDKAMFDPRDDHAISALMKKGLTDDPFRKMLTGHAAKQVRKFSWEQSAQAAWRAVERMVERREQSATPKQTPQPPAHRPKLAYLSPLRGARSGIADYSAELLPELSRHYDIDVIVCQDEPITDEWVLANAPIHSVDWFYRNYHHFDRVMYHFGNSAYHSHMFDVLQDIPGIVVLHDFFLSGIVAHLDVTGEKPGFWARSLLYNHGWQAVLERFTTNDTADVVWAYPCNGEVFRSLIGGVAHSKHSLKLAMEWHNDSAFENWAHIPHLRRPLTNPRDGSADRLRSAARALLGIRDDDFVVCAFGHLGPTKMNDRLIEAWLSSELAGNAECQLVFVGQNEGGRYVEDLNRRIASGENRVRITGFVDTETYREWLLAADVAVQLRKNSRGETSGAVLDCWNASVATIVNAHGALADLPDDCVVKLPDTYSDKQLAAAMRKLYRDPSYRNKIGAAGSAFLSAHHAPRRCADAYATAIEDSYTCAAYGVHGLVKRLPHLVPNLDATDRVAAIAAVAKNLPANPPRRQWLIDRSRLVHTDDKTGIQRVVKSILIKLLQNTSQGVIIEPIYAIPGEKNFRYARKFTCRMLGIPDGWCDDELVQSWPGDVYLGLDLEHSVPSDLAVSLRDFRSRGIKTISLVYDLLPVLKPSTFPPGTADLHNQWLQAIAELDGALCISRAVADELSQWLDVNGSKSRRLPFDLHYFHLGADIEQSKPTTGLPDNGADLLEEMSKSPSFLMVGTIEPRKGHALVLKAFETLWKSGRNAQLVIVGKQGWMVEELIEQLRAHPELDKRLHWLEGISDEFLEQVYGKADCLIAASEGEGFGLPLIEAARHGLPILARDIPVFREVAGDHAAYFTANISAPGLASDIERWITSHSRNRHPRPDGMKWLTWAESAGAVCDVLLGKSQPYKRWLPKGPK